MIKLIGNMRGSRNFRQGGWGGGGGGVQVSLTKKKALTFFVFCLFFVLRLFYRSQIQRNLSFFKVPEGVQHFPGGGGGPTFSRGGGPIAYLL